MAENLTLTAIREWLSENGYIAAFWHIDDVKGIRPDLDDEQAMEVLNRVDHYHDCEHGITWLHLEMAADYLYPEQTK